MHGFASATAVNAIANESLKGDRPLIALYVGDCDPSGMYMSEVDLPERMERYGGEVRIMRIALRENDLPGLPSFDAIIKQGDRWFLNRDGKQCWELDAMSPVLLRERVRDEIEQYIDRDSWDRAVEVEAAEVESMCDFHERWQRSISRLAGKYPDGGA